MILQLPNNKCVYIKKKIETTILSVVATLVCCQVGRLGALLLLLHSFVSLL